MTKRVHSREPDAGAALPEDQRPNDFLARWSRRKHLGKHQDKQGATESVAVPEEQTTSVETLATPPQGASADTHTPQQATVSQVQSGSGAVDRPGDASSEHGQAEPVSPVVDADMPPVESLTAKSDISDFFKPGVSAALRKAALRHVFQQPEYNIRDGLNDYDGDYTVFEPLGDTITADMRFHAARKERERLEALAESEQSDETSQELDSLTDSKLTDSELADSESADSESADSEFANSESANSGDQQLAEQSVEQDCEQSEPVPEAGEEAQHAALHSERVDTSADKQGTVAEQSDNDATDVTGPDVTTAAHHAGSGIQTSS